jgi:excisionase family DNA binding protein
MRVAQTTYLKPNEYAELMRVDLRTVYRNLAKKNIPGAVKVGGQWRIEVKGS